MNNKGKGETFTIKIDLNTSDDKMFCFVGFFFKLCFLITFWPKRTVPCKYTWIIPLHHTGKYN